MYKKIFPLIFILALIVPGSVNAQEDLTLSVVELKLLPEFDQPSMLVWYDITLPAQATQDTLLTLRMPVEAGRPHALAARQPDGLFFDLEYDQQVSGDWIQVSFQTTSQEVRFEYYDPRLMKDGASRHFEYQWPGDYAVENMRILVQQPAGASNMRISPDMGSGREDPNDGLVYYSYDAGSLPNGQLFTISIDYQKPDDELSSSTLPIQPSAPIDETTTGRTTPLMSLLPWILGSLGLLLIVGGMVWYWQTSRERERPAPRRPRRKPAAQLDEAISAEGHIYCHECGKRAGPGDRFCRTCGTQLRSG